MRLLLVDDHLLFRSGLAGLLSAQPDITIVGLAKSVAEAIAQTEEVEPDIVLMDFSLPDGTGLEATQAILRSKPETKIVFLSVHDDDDRLFAAIRGGATGYLPKNISVNDLIAYLRGVESGAAAITPQLTTRVLNEFARSQSGPTDAVAGINSLTPRELEVLQELETGASNQEIAERLLIAERTVKNHLSKVFSKLNVTNRLEAAEFARQHGLAKPSEDLG